MTTIMFTPGPDGHTVRFAYNPAVVAAIKEVVPSYARSWMPDTKTWLIDPSWASVLADTLRMYGHTVTGLHAHHPDHGRRHNDDADWARMLFRRVGPHGVGLVFRALTKCFHPDVGGDTELQRELNSAYAEISTTRRESA